MRVFFGMILGAALLTLGVYISDTIGSTPPADGQTAAPHRTLVNWDVASENWEALKTRTRQDWAKLSAN